MAMDILQGFRILAGCLRAGNVQFTGMATRWCSDCVHCKGAGVVGGGSRPSKYSAFLFFHMGPKHWEDRKRGREPGNLNV